MCDINTLTEHDSGEGGRHGKAELEVLGSERAEAGDEEVETGREHGQHPERRVAEDAACQGAVLGRRRLGVGRPPRTSV